MVKPSASEFDQSQQKFWENYVSQVLLQLCLYMISARHGRYGNLRRKSNGHTFPGGRRPASRQCQLRGARQLRQGGRP